MALLSAEFRGNNHIDRDELIPSPPLVQADYALVAQPEYGASLSSFGNLQLFLAFEGGHGDVGAENGLSNSNRYLAVNVVPLALEKRVLLNEDDHIEIAQPVRLVHAGLTFSLNAQPRAVVHARGNLQLEDFFFPHEAAAMTSVARIANNPSFTITLMASAADGKKALLVTYLAGALACRAGHGALSLRGTASPACAHRFPGAES